MKIINEKLAVEKLKSGLPIIFQTDTLPAIGCLPKFSKMIYEIKKRNRKKPLILMAAEKKQLNNYVHDSAKEDYENIALKYWPGALTIIVPVSENRRDRLTSENFTLGMRVPNSTIAQSLIMKTGPLLTSSANISGIQGSVTVEGIADDFPNVDILGPVPWTKCSGSASTIISWVESRKWEILRRGQVFINELR